MLTQLCLLQHALPELFAEVSYTGQVTVADRYGLMAAVLADSLNEEERESLDRILHAAHKGKLALVDELSRIQY